MIPFLSARRDGPRHGHMNIELQDVLLVLESGTTLDEARPEMAYALNFEFDSAISDFLLPMAAERE